MKYYKCLKRGRVSTHQDYQWPYRKWLPKVEKVELCKSGYHACRADQLFEWFSDEIWFVELRGDIVIGGDKVAAQEARLVKRVMTHKKLRLFVCDCAERVVHLTNDERCNNSIRIARRFALGIATENDLSAARSAAWDAARAAALDATWSAARSAAWAAALDTTRAAARDAAWSATRAAARSAALDTTRPAARAAAWDKERKWQIARLTEYLEGQVDIEAIRKSITGGAG